MLDDAASHEESSWGGGETYPLSSSFKGPRAADSVFSKDIRYPHLAAIAF